MSARVFLAGAYEHPGRHLPGTSLTQIHTEVAVGALADAGLSFEEVDGYCSTPDAPGLGLISMADHLGMPNLTFTDTTESGGSAYLAHVGHAALAIEAGLCSVVLITMAGKARSGAPRLPAGYLDAPELPLESAYGTSILAEYAMFARRFMYEYGTTSTQLAAVKVTSSEHASFNPHAFLTDPVTIEQVLDSPYVADPLHRLDCCINTDGGGAVVMVSEDVARRLDRHCVRLLGHATATAASWGGAMDLTRTGAAAAGPRAFAAAGVTPADINYASIYDSFTITVLAQLGDLGLVDRRNVGEFALAGELRAPHGRLPVNTDGGGLSNNHPGGRGGMPKIIEAVRQLRGEAHPALQVPDCRLVLVSGTGGSIGTRTANATLIFDREDA